MSSKEVSYLAWGKDLKFSIYVQKEKFGYMQNGNFSYREKNLIKLFCFKVQALNWVPKKLFKILI